MLRKRKRILQIYLLRLLPTLQRVHRLRFSDYEPSQTCWWRSQTRCTRRSPDGVDDHCLEEKPAAPEAALDKVLVMLGDLSIRMNRMKVSQREQAGKHRRDSMESSVFGSALGVGAGIDLQALERTSSPKRSPNDVSLAIYFVARTTVMLMFKFNRRLKWPQTST